MQITYEKIRTEQKSLLSNLLEYYVYEFTPYLNELELGDDGLYQFEKLDHFFDNTAYDPYLIRVNQKIAGFVIVKKIDENNFTIFTIDQLFIMKKYSGQGIGKVIARQIFDQYRGKWRVHQKEKNYPAQAFWRSVIKEYTNGNYTERYNPLNRDSIQEFVNDPTSLIVASNEDITIKRLELGDVEPLFELIDKSRKHLRQWLPWVDNSKSVEDTKNFIIENAGQYFSNGSFTAGIWFRGEIVGCIGFHLIDWSNRCTSMGYWLGERFQGKGIMTSSVRSLMDYAFYQLKMNRVIIRAATENKKSRSIPERLGFHIEGCLRQNEWLYDHFVDHVIYSMLVEDWVGGKDEAY